MTNPWVSYSDGAGFIGEPRLHPDDCRDGERARWEDTERNREAMDEEAAKRGEGPAEG